MSGHLANTISHFDIFGPDPARLQTFYADVFGWTILARGPGYAQVSTPGDAANGAIVHAPQAALTIGIVVSDLATALDRAVASGGEVVMPDTDNGWVRKATVADPAGNRLTLIQG
jgi:predicted enzyme related to lactoylglutathione lyase